MSNREEMAGLGVVVGVVAAEEEQEEEEEMGVVEVDMEDVEGEEVVEDPGIRREHQTRTVEDSMRPQPSENS